MIGPGGLPSPTELRIQNCTASPCSVIRGSVIGFEADITASKVIHLNNL